MQAPKLPASKGRKKALYFVKTTKVALDKSDFANMVRIRNFLLVASLSCSCTFPQSADSRYSSSIPAAYPQHMRPHACALPSPTLGVNCLQH